MANKSFVKPFCIQEIKNMCHKKVLLYNFFEEREKKRPIHRRRPRRSTRPGSPSRSPPLCAAARERNCSPTPPPRRNRTLVAALRICLPSPPAAGSTSKLEQLHRRGAEPPRCRRAASRLLAAGLPCALAQVGGGAPTAGAGTERKKEERDDKGEGNGIWGMERRALDRGRYSRGSGVHHMGRRDDREFACRRSTGKPVFRT